MCRRSQKVYMLQKLKSINMCRRNQKVYMCVSQKLNYRPRNFAILKLCEDPAHATRIFRKVTNLTGYK